MQNTLQNFWLKLYNNKKRNGIFHTKTDLINGSANNTHTNKYVGFGYWS